MISLFVSACNLIDRAHDNENNDIVIELKRYDQLQYRFLSNGDYSALQQMNTTYPIETRTLLENVLQLGTVDDGGVNDRFLKYFQDTTLQIVMTEVETKFADVSDINEKLSKAIRRLCKKIPSLPIPTVYTQIGAFSQSIVIGNDNNIGICLDKYLGKDNPVYTPYYNSSQRRMMTREYIVPDCLLFYLISLFPMENFETASQAERDNHIGRIQWVVNYAMDTKFYKTPECRQTNDYMKKNKNISFTNLLQIQ